MLVEYVGRMGSFLYDDSEFHVECAGTAEEHLQYIGKGNSVEIPVGIKNLSYMFKDCVLPKNFRIGGLIGGTYETRGMFDGTDLSHGLNIQCCLVDFVDVFSERTIFSERVKLLRAMTPDEDRDKLTLHIFGVKHPGLTVVSYDCFEYMDNGHTPVEVLQYIKERYPRMANTLWAFILYVAFESVEFSLEVWSDRFKNYNQVVGGVYSTFAADGRSVEWLKLMGINVNPNNPDKYSKLYKID